MSMAFSVKRCLHLYFSDEKCHSMACENEVPRAFLRFMANTSPLTVAFPVFNEGPLVEEFIQTVDSVCGQIPDYAVDLLIVNDGSTDDTLKYIQTIPLRFAKSMTILNLAKNVGHSFAVQCLIDHISKPVAILMDADFQDDPQDIPRLVDIFKRTKCDIVRVARSDQPGDWLDKLLFAAFRWFYRFLAHEKYAFGTFGLYSFKAIQNLRAFSHETHRYFPNLVNSVGLKTEIVTLPRSERRKGVSKMGKHRLFHLALDAFFAASALPIRMASFLGILVTGLALAGILVIVYIRLFTNLAYPGWSSILASVVFFGGVQRLFFGVLRGYTTTVFGTAKD